MAGPKVNSEFYFPETMVAFKEKQYSLFPPWPAFISDLLYLSTQK